MEIKRDNYLNKLRRSRHNGMIKIVTGLRRSGKSYLLFKLFYDALLRDGVAPHCIQRIAMDDVRNEHLLNPVELVETVEKSLIPDRMNYILLDEVQMVRNFTGALNTLLRMENVDIYVTGSNSKFLSSDVATEFRGRGDEIHLYSLSFAEFSSFSGNDLHKNWKDYVLFGGLPQVVLQNEEEAKVRYLQNLYRSVYIKDLKERHKINKESQFEDIVKIMASNIGSPCNPTKLSNTFQSVTKESLHSSTIHTFLNYLEDAFLIEKVTRYDVKGKKHVGALSKYYFSDIGLRNAILNFRQQEESHIMENIIFNELKSRGFNVNVGIVEVRERQGDSLLKKQFEVDFVANKDSRRFYIQSALEIPNQRKMQQESASLRNIQDAFKKIIIVRNDFRPWYNEDGILILSLYDFLLNPASLDL